MRSLVKNFVLVSRGSPIRLPPQFDTPDAMPSLSLPASPAARLTLPADELERRLTLYAERAEAGVPVCTGVGVPEPHAGNAEPIRCWACGAQPAKRWAKGDGWVSRRLPFNVVEVYCPTCLGEWGWPEDWA